MRSETELDRCRFAHETDSPPSPGCEPAAVAFRLERRSGTPFLPLLLAPVPGSVGRPESVGLGINS